MTPQQAKALQDIAKAVVKAVMLNDHTPTGQPGGYLYAGMMGQGCTLNQYEQIMSGLVGAGMVTKTGECYKTTEKGRSFAN